MMILSIAHGIAYKESLEKLKNGTETMENHLKLKVAKEQEDSEWARAGKNWE